MYNKINALITKALEQKLIFKKKADLVFKYE